MMSFPDKTRFTPYVVARNISATPLDVTPVVWWMKGIVPMSRRLPVQHMNPYKTVTLDMDGALAKAGLANLAGSFNVLLETQGTSRALLAAAGSVDQDHTYVFEVATMAVTESVAKALSYWSIADGDDTMVTLWNPADEAQDFTFVLYFSGGDKQYSYPIHLNGRETRSLNISEIVHNPAPDSDGNVIPPSVTSGRAVLMGSHGESEHILVSVDSGVYNVRKATCGNQFCKTCQGAVNAFLGYSPFYLAQGQGLQQTLTAQSKSGSTYDYTKSASWTSSNTSVATVSQGMVTAMSPGSITLDAEDDNMPDYSYACYTSNPDATCPMSTGGGASGPGTVTSVSITNASITGDNVAVTTSGPSGTSGTLMVTVSGAAGSFTLYNNTSAGPGNYSFGFQRNSLATGQYSSVRASWVTGSASGGESSSQMTSQATSPVSFDVLGSYHHTQYNSPWENACTGAPAAAVITTSSCSLTNSTLKSDFISQVNLNGSGFSLSWGGVQKEALCTKAPYNAPNNDSFRKKSPPAGSCNSNTGALNSNTVAVDPNSLSNGLFQCGDQILIVDTSGSTKAVKTVTDKCPACAGQAHMDNYSTSQSCSSGEVGDYGTGHYQTIRLR